MTLGGLNVEGLSARRWSEGGHHHESARYYNYMRSFDKKRIILKKIWNRHESSEALFLPCLAREGVEARAKNGSELSIVGSGMGFWFMNHRQDARATFERHRSPP